MGRGFRHGGASSSQDNPNVKYLYKLGDEYSTLTGGYTGRAYGQYTGSDRCNPAVSKESLRLNVYQGAVRYTDYGAFGCGTMSLIDLTEYKTLYMKYALNESAVNEMSLDVTSINQPVYIGACYNFHTSNTWVRLLVSNATSGYGIIGTQLGAGYSASTHLYIYEIRLEK